jgi:predicted MFS family arabinose efflux permease
VTSGPNPVRIVLAGSVALTTTVVPAFLTGALSGRIGDDLGFGAGATGAAVAAFFVGAGVGAVPMGRVTERIGPTRALRTGALVSAAAALGIAALASSWWQLTALLVVAGSAVGLVDTGAARAFGDAVPPTRHGIAFGAKEASVPAASLAAGLSIPVLAEQLGWRAAFVAGALLAPLVWVLVPRLSADRPPPSDGRSGARGRGPMVLFAAGVALGVGAATAASTLLVPAIEDRGWDEADAGVLLAVASGASIAVRLGAGSRGDRQPRSTWAMVATLLVVGATGAVLLAATSAGPAGVLGAIAVIGGGWGWTGLAFQTAVRVGRDRPAAAASVVLTGLSIGGAAGPAAFGAIASAVSYSAAWATAAVALLAGAAAILASKHWLEAAVAEGRSSAAR